jgi:hypothetical protein
MGFSEFDRIGCNLSVARLQIETVSFSCSLASSSTCPAATCGSRARVAPDPSCFAGQAIERVTNGRDAGGQIAGERSWIDPFARTKLRTSGLLPEKRIDPAECLAGIHLISRDPELAVIDAATGLSPAPA